MDLLTTSAVARLLELSAESVRAFERAGKLLATRTESGMRLFRRADVERLAAERRRRRQGKAAPVVGEPRRKLGRATD
jgi:DNA-binding transcriptional MerR regulator